MFSHVIISKEQFPCTAVLFFWTQFWEGEGANSSKGRDEKEIHMH